MSMIITYDTVADAAYIRLSDDEVARTVESKDDVMVDLDMHHVVVGIEILGMHTALPFSDLSSRFHVHSDVVDQLRLIWPGVTSGLSFSHGNDGSLSPGSRTLELIDR